MECLLENFACDIFLNSFFCHIIQRCSYTQQALLKCPETVWGHHIIHPSIYCTYIASHISHFCMGFISLNRKDVSLKKLRSIRNPIGPSACSLQLQEPRANRDIVKMLLCHCRKTSDRQMQRKMSLSCPLLREQVYGFDIDISDSLLNPSIKKPSLYFCLQYKQGVSLCGWCPPRERERERDTSLLSCFRERERERSTRKSLLWDVHLSSRCGFAVVWNRKKEPLKNKGKLVLTDFYCQGLLM